MLPSANTCSGMAVASPKPSTRLSPRLGPPTTSDVRRALQTLGRAGAPVVLLEALEDWSADQMRPAA